MRKRIAVKQLALLLLFLAPGLLPAQESGNESIDRGIDAFRNRNIDEAIGSFEGARLTEPGNDEIHKYLGILYQQAGRPEKAEEVYAVGIAVGGPNRDILIRNRGQLRFAQGRLDDARSDFTLLVDGGGDQAVPARLDRANAALNAGDFVEAREDYVTYLVEAPGDPQRGEIERLIALLTAHITALEDQRASEAERLRLEEEARRLEEQRRAEEEARQQALLNEVLESLEKSEEETRSIRAGNERLQEDLEDSELED